MATFPQPIPMNRTSMPATAPRELNAGIVGRVFGRSRAFWCGLRGHDNLMHFEKERLFLECATCGHVSPGWALTGTPPKVVLRGDARRHALIRPRLVGAERRIA